MSATNFVKQGNYEQSPQLCNCPWERRQFTGHDITVDLYICTSCGAMHRIRPRIHDRDKMEEARDAF